MSFASPKLLILILLLLPIFWLRGKRRAALGHTQVELHKKLRRVPLAGRLPAVLLAMFWAALVASMAAPQLTQHSEKTTVRTRNYLLVVDVSGSMDSPLTVKGQQDLASGATPAQGTTSGASSTTTTVAGVDAPPEPKPPTRAIAAEAGARLFVDNPNRKGDRIGIILFDDQPYNVWPLSLDLNTIKRKLFLISEYKGSGTNFSGPDENIANTGGVQAGINHLLEITKPDETRVLIMVTDGEDSISPKRYDELVAALEKEHIKLYVLGVGETWGASSKSDLQRLAEDAGGVVIAIGDTQAMQDGFAKIDRLEKTTTQVDPITSHLDISQWFLAAAAILGLLYLASIGLAADDA